MHENKIYTTNNTNDLHMLTMEKMAVLQSISYMLVRLNCLNKPLSVEINAKLKPYLQAEQNSSQLEEQIKALRTIQATVKVVVLPTPPTKMTKAATAITPTTNLDAEWAKLVDKLCAAPCQMKTILLGFGACERLAIKPWKELLLLRELESDSTKPK